MAPSGPDDVVIRTRGLSELDLRVSRAQWGRQNHHHQTAAGFGAADGRPCHPIRF